MLDDPLMRFLGDLERETPARYGETVNLAPLFSCQGALLDALSADITSAFRCRVANADLIAPALQDVGWKPLRPAEGLRSGILLLQARTNAARNTSASSLRQMFHEVGIALTTYAKGIVRISLPAQPWQSRDAIHLAHVFGSVAHELEQPQLRSLLQTVKDPCHEPRRMSRQTAIRPIADQCQAPGQVPSSRGGDVTGGTVKSLNGNDNRRLMCAISPRCVSDLQLDPCERRCHNSGRSASGSVSHLFRASCSRSLDKGLDFVAKKSIRGTGRTFSRMLQELTECLGDCFGECRNQPEAEHPQHDEEGIPFVQPTDLVAKKRDPLASLGLNSTSAACAVIRNACKERQRIRQLSVIQIVQSAIGCLHHHGVNSASQCSPILGVYNLAKPLAVSFKCHSDVSFS